MPNIPERERDAARSGETRNAGTRPRYSKSPMRARRQAYTSLDVAGGEQGHGRNTAQKHKMRSGALRRITSQTADIQQEVASLPGKPDIVFFRKRLAVFCDGDFWHGRRWKARKEKLARGSNGQYWVAKIAANISRDRMQRAALRKGGWRVTRIWGTEILKDPERVARRVVVALK